MIGKYLEKRIEVLPDESINGVANPIELEYYLLEGEIIDFDELSGMKTYGMEIVKKIDNIKVECSTVNNFSCSREGTRQTIDLLVKNTVTPVSLYYVLDDMIGI